jgi:hypothetical protein
MQEVLQHIIPTMEQLEQERQELAECITTVKALTLHEQSAHAKVAAQMLLLQQQQQQGKQAQQQSPTQQQQQQQQQPQGRVGASRAAGRRAAAVRQVSAATAATLRRSVRARGTSAAAAASAKSRKAAAAAANAAAGEVEPSPVGYYMSLLQQAMEAEPEAVSHTNTAAAAAAPTEGSAAANGSAAGSSSEAVVAATATSSSGSSSMSRHMQGMCKDMVADMDRRLMRWRTLSGARSAVSFVFRSEQLASLLLASFPYLPMTAVMCDYVPAAWAAAVKRQQLQAHPAAAAEDGRS